VFLGEGFLPNSFEGQAAGKLLVFLSLVNSSPIACFIYASDWQELYGEMFGGNSVEELGTCIGDTSP